MRHFVKAQCRQRVHRRMTSGPQYQWRAKYFETVGQSAIKETRMDAGPAFDKQARDAAIGKRAKNGGNIGAAPCIPADNEDLYTQRAQFAAAIGDREYPGWELARCLRKSR